MHWTFLIAAFLAGAFLGMLTVFVIAIRREERHMGITHSTRISRAEAGTRRALGYVRKSDELPDHEQIGR